MSARAQDDLPHGVPRFTLTVIDGIVYGRVGRLATTQLDSRSRHARRSARRHRSGARRLLAFQAKPDDAAWSFDGTPVSDGRRLFVAMRHSDVTPHAYVACFDAATRRSIVANVDRRRRHARRRHAATKSRTIC